MRLHQTRMTITGFVGKDPVRLGHEGSTPVCSFTVASTDTGYNAQTQNWKDFPTTWVTVKAFKTLASHALQSIHKGDPVLVTGSVVTEQWTRQGQKQSALVLEAESIGHDMSKGISTFQRIKDKHKKGNSPQSYQASDKLTRTKTHQEMTSAVFASSTSNTRAGDSSEFDNADHANDPFALEDTHSQTEVDTQKASSNIPDAF